jgi:hypothetical protein
MNRPRFYFLSALALFAAVSRLAPHPENVTPLAAVALFGAATFTGRRSAVLVPLGALLASDLALELTHRAGWQPVPGFYAGQWVVYACILATVGLGFLLRRHRNVPAIALATLGSASLFFVLTNFVYFYGPDSLYPRTWPGLLECYARALPFFRNSLAGDLTYSALLFGALGLAEAMFPALRGGDTDTEILRFGD